MLLRVAPSTAAAATESGASAVWSWLLDGPVQTFVVLLIGALALAIARRVIGSAVRSVVAGGTQVRRQARRLLLRSADAVAPHDEVALARRGQRAETMGSVLRSTAALVIGIVVVTVLANIWGWNLGPVLASAGVVGVALGFGAQTLVKDFLSGVFLLVEDQYGVGDVVDLGEASGVVESIGLRVTQVRDLQGTLWYVRNGEVLRVGNKSQGWSRALVEVRVTPEQDVTGAVDRLRAAASDLADDADLGPLLLAEPEVTAFEDLSGEQVTLRAMVKTLPGKQWEVQRGLRARIREEFATAGLTLALPHREMLVGPAVAAVTGRSVEPDPDGAQDQNSTG